MFAAKMIELDEKIRQLHERIDYGENTGTAQLNEEISSLWQEYQLEKDAIRYRLSESKSPKIQSLLSAYDEMQKTIHEAASSDPSSSANENAEVLALLAEYALDFAILSADRALLLALRAIHEQRQGGKEELQS